MTQKTNSTPRREQSLTRDRIIEASVELLDSSGEGGLTFRALSERLATGPGAIYWHVANKSELLTAACDAVIARTLSACVVGTTQTSTQEASTRKPTLAENTIRALALGMFDAIDAHPWVGSALTQAAGQLPVIRIIERIGQQVRALGVSDKEEWAAVSALMSYILGVAGQNAVNGQFARTHGIDRSEFLGALSQVWSDLDPDEYPFTRSVAGLLRDHDDRADFLTGIDLILNGITRSDPA